MRSSFTQFSRLTHDETNTTSLNDAGTTYETPFESAHLKTYPKNRDALAILTDSNGLLIPVDNEE